MSPEGAVRGGTDALLRLDAAAVVEARAGLAGARRRVVKFGSAVLTRAGEGLDTDAVDRFAAVLAGLPGELVVVSSGAVAAGLSVLGHARRPESLAELQAAAAVGQAGLIGAWEKAFARHGRATALVLLTHDDVTDRTRYLNARNTLRALLARGVVPVVNENDTVATDEIRFGDNDTLAALVANLVEADLLALVTDIDGLREADPRQVPGARRIAAARAGDEGLDAMVGPGAGRLGRGGMETKLRAARLAARSGAGTLVLDGRGDGVRALADGSDAGGTLLVPDRAPLAARKRWIAGQLQTRGELILDAGAVRVLREAGRSLLPVGVLAVRGRFARGEVVLCRDEAGREVARGLANYSAGEVERILGCTSEEIAARLGHAGEPELVHRDNLVLS